MSNQLSENSRLLEAAKKLGLISTENKAKCARENAKKGGRPKRQAIQECRERMSKYSPDKRKKLDDKLKSILENG